MKECECCGSNVNKLNISENYYGSGITRNVCDICYSTQCGTLGFKNIRIDNETVLMAMAQCTNLILDAIKRKK